jgi:hypothetical protein
MDFSSRLDPMPTRPGLGESVGKSSHVAFASPEHYAGSIAYVSINAQKTEDVDFHENDGGRCGLC